MRILSPTLECGCGLSVGAANSPTYARTGVINVDPAASIAAKQTRRHPSSLLRFQTTSPSSPGVDSQKGQLQFNSRQSSTVDTSIPFSARYIKYSIEYS
eukprot:4060460-Pyramimonas_sp.AAC.1